MEYLIFEMASGDVRAYLDDMQELDLAFALRTLHHVAAGLKQLHSAKIAHQDLKPSNVLVFKDESKLGDLGRAWTADVASPYDAFTIAGDQGYAPPEMLYGHIDSDVGIRRYGCDMYHLGNIVVFLFSRTNMTALINKFLSPSHRPVFWASDYAAALPYVQAAFAKAIDEFELSIPARLRSDIIEIVKQLCEPDPTRRGHPSARVNVAGPTALERFVTRFDLMAYRAENRIFEEAK